MIMTDGGPIRPEQLGLPETREHEHVGGAEGPLRLSIPEAEKRMVVEALSRSQGNRSEAARLLGLTRSQLYTRLKRFGLSA
jgi:two-component system NtrC family response regulator/two-component system response regulator PilR (NtrC family)